MNRQKGFSLIEALLIVVVLGIVGFGGYYVWNQNREEQAENTKILQNNTINREEQDTTPQEEIDEKSVPDSYEIIEGNGYTLAYDPNNKPTITMLGTNNFLVSNKGGGKLTYDKSSSSFVESGDVAERTDKSVDTYNTQAYLWGDGDAGTISNSYFVVLDEETIIRVAYSYTYEDSSLGQKGLTQNEIDNQMEKDLVSIKTFELTNIQ